MQLQFFLIVSKIALILLFLNCSDLHTICFFVTILSSKLVVFITNRKIRLIFTIIFQIFLKLNAKTEPIIGYISFHNPFDVSLHNVLRIFPRIFIERSKNQ